MNEPHIDELEELRRHNADAPMTVDERRQTRDRIFKTLRGERRPSYALRAAAVGLVAAAASVVLLIYATRDEAWYQPVSGAQCLTRVGAELDVTAECAAQVAIEVASFDVRLEPGTRLQRAGRGRVRLQRGRARFARPKRNRGAEFRVEVSHGFIVVVGTVFTVAQAEQSGTLEVQTGSVRFVWADSGEAQAVGAGESLQWPRPVEETAEEPDSTAPDAGGDGRARRRSQKQGKTEDIEQVLRRQFQLRGQRRFAEAIALLREAAGNRKYTRRQRERLSYELGHLLQQHASTEEACQHWRNHLSRYRHAGGATEEVKVFLRERCQ